MKFTFTHLEIPDIIEVEHQSIGDTRGFFAEVYREEEFKKAGLPEKGNFVQENHSRSVKGVLRGLHYQLQPRAQGKLVRCVRGAIFDVVVDLRKKSPHYKHWIGRVLSDENRKMLYIPPGFAHGFCTISDWADMEYKVTDYFSQEHERGIRWDDPELRIEWPLKSPQLSPKDAAYPSLAQAEHNF